MFVEHVYHGNIMTCIRGVVTAKKDACLKLSNCFIKIQYHYNLKDTFMASPLLEKHESARIKTNRVPIHGSFPRLSRGAAARYRPRSRLGRRVDNLY